MSAFYSIAEGGSGRSGVVRWWVREGDQTRGFITIYGVKSPERAATSFALSVGAKPVEVDELSLPDCGEWWYGRRYGFTGRDTKRTEPPHPQACADWIAKRMADDRGDVVLGVAFESCRQWEVRALDEWVLSRVSAFDSTGDGGGTPVRTRMIAAGDSAPELLRSIPGQLYRYMFSPATHKVSSRRTAGAVIGAGLTGAALSFGASVAGVPAATPIGIGNLMVAAVGMVSWMTRWPNLAARHINADSEYGLIQVERQWELSPRRSILNAIAPIGAAFGPIAARMGVGAPDPNADPDAVRQVKLFPYTRNTLVLRQGQAGQILAVPSPTDTSVAAVMSSRLVPAPPQVRRAQGARVGFDMDGYACRVPDKDREVGVFLAGDPGRGKTVALCNLWYADLVARRWGTGEGPQRNGQMALIWIETKTDNEDVRETDRRAGYTDDQIVRINVTDDTGMFLDLVDRTQPARSAAALVEAMAYAWESGAIGPRAAAVLRAAFTLALAITPEIAAKFRWDSVPNAMVLCEIIMGGRPQDGLQAPLLEALSKLADEDLRRVHGDRAQAAATEASERIQADAEAVASDVFAGSDPTTSARAAEDILADFQSVSGSELWDAVRAWGYYTELARKNARLVSEMIEAPRNKVAELAAANAMWTPNPNRERVTFRDLLRYHAVVELNMAGTNHNRLDERLAKRMSAITLHLLWDAIKTHCVGWQADGQSVGIFCDELSLISGTGSGHDVIQALYDQGRSFGVQLAFATQRIGQLPDRTQQAVNSFGTRCYMGLESTDDARNAAFDLTGGIEGSYTTADIRQLSQGSGVIRTRINGEGQPPFNIFFASIDELELDTYMADRRDTPQLEAGPL